MAFGNTQSVRGTAIVAAQLIPTTFAAVTATFTGVVPGDQPYVSTPTISDQRISVQPCPVVTATNVITVRLGINGGATIATATYTMTVTAIKATGEDNIPPG